MTRILADLPDEEIERLDRIAREQGKSRAAVLREAVASYHAQPADGDTSWIDAAFGAWQDRDDIGDAVEWQRRERAGSTRPWDVDYPEVRAEFPDLFDEADDREHEMHKAWLARQGVTPGDGYPAAKSQTAAQEAPEGKRRRPK